jgi:hypothetical protein
MDYGVSFLSEPAKCAHCGVEIDIDHWVFWYKGKPYCDYDCNRAAIYGGLGDRPYEKLLRGHGAGA